MKVSIIGATGYGGLELLRLLHQHPHVEIVSLHSFSAQTDDISRFYPHLHTVYHHELAEIDVTKIAEESEAVFLATPSGVAKEAAQPFIDAGMKVIDLSGDFRLSKEKYEKWYNKDAAPEAYLNQAEYGLAEWRENVETTFISNPGCYATATLLGLAPLVMEGKIEADSIIVDAKSGISGAGKTPSVNTHFPETNENMTLYRMNQHQHIPEIIRQLRVWDAGIDAITFSTSLIPVTRGIFATIYVKAKDATSTEELLALYRKSYDGKPFVRIQDKDVYPSLKQVTASNFCDIGLCYNERTNMITIVVVIDNLVKGAAGQAIQNLNLMAGFEETAGLDFIPLYP
ncbi:N-acetyl-gamma-glutamyl-phosphate reductase [Listeria weihenstephanensis]|uniref:N-acetyl-gamma-glutamyl-phosphate reductase n=1 Tax=Listeria weihenstephanensis TaxID=1006155 RepID=A0A841Z8S4_9LIST|nr:N-acetyl-gamma-glutamyl-phosphate reductase [Listeria weihenstephanensis]MBC1500867.1 N-acetyl-gamma-glutamyl-phosphate reductase [Listeria weihenstephanensis]